MQRVKTYPQISQIRWNHKAATRPKQSEHMQGQRVLEESLPGYAIKSVKSVKSVESVESVEAHFVPAALRVLIRN